MRILEQTTKYFKKNLHFYLHICLKSSNFVLNFTKWVLVYYIRYFYLSLLL